MRTIHSPGGYRRIPDRTVPADTGPSAGSLG
jgi:hypothetical protein